MMRTSLQRLNTVTRHSVRTFSAPVQQNLKPLYLDAQSTTALDPRYALL